MFNSSFSCFSSNISSDIGKLSPVTNYCEGISKFWKADDLEILVLFAHD